MAIRLDTPSWAGRGRSRAASAAVGIGLLVSLSACGSSDSTTATDQAAGTPGSSRSAGTTQAKDAVKPASGPMLSAQGFSFHAPKGWADVTDHAATGVLLSAAHAADEQPLAITVRRVAPGARTPAAARAKASALLEQAGATHVRVLADTTVGGNPAAHVVGIQSKPGTHYQLDVYYVRTAKAGWPLMFATNQYTTGDRRDTMLASVLATCRWQRA
jgi:hypothetical protein